MQTDPRLNLHNLRGLVLRMFGTPYGDREWKPVEGQDARSILMLEGNLVCMHVQSWSDRVSWAMDRCRDSAAFANAITVARVLMSQLKYVAGESK